MGKFIIYVCECHSRALNDLFHLQPVSFSKLVMSDVQSINCSSLSTDIDMWRGPSLCYILRSVLIIYMGLFK